MKQALLDRLNKLKGKEELLMETASNFPIKNKAWVLLSEIQAEIEFLEGLLAVKNESL